MTIIFLAATCLISCIKEEAANDEADITACWLEDGLMDSEPQIFNDSVVLTVKSGVDVSRLAPRFTLSDGASIYPTSGTTLDFSNTQYYTVTSESGRWSKRYAVKVLDRSAIANADELRLDFENMKSNGYPIFYESGLPLLGSFDWASGNAGFALTGVANADSDYPTHQSIDSHDGKCAELTTCLTGTFGAMFNKPLAAGNLFLGTFNLAVALTDPLDATRFGMPIRSMPTKFSGWMNYHAGPTYYSFDESESTKLRAVEGRKDRCAIYAILYEPTTDKPYLNGDNPLDENNPNIISAAALPDDQCYDSDGWKHFEIDFVMRPGKSIDAEKLRQGAYNLAIVFSSSADGDLFSGAIGSCLKIDNITITFQNEEQ